MSWGHFPDDQKKKKKVLRHFDVCCPTRTNTHTKRAQYLSGHSSLCVCVRAREGVVFRSCGSFRAAEQLPSFFPFFFFFLCVCVCEKKPWIRKKTFKCFFFTFHISFSPDGAVSSVVFHFQKTHEQQRLPPSRQLD